jgi:hypothetical protein
MNLTASLRPNVGRLQTSKGCQSTMSQTNEAKFHEIHRHRQLSLILRQTLTQTPPPKPTPTPQYNAMGTQAALVGGFSVTTLTSVSISGSQTLAVRWMFFCFSSISLACSISCILNATFVTVWGPGLALRGPRGSMAKAYFGMVHEQTQIFGSFVTALFFFALQSIIAFWIIDNSHSEDADRGSEEHQVHSIFATFVMGSGMLYAVYALRRMFYRFHDMHEDELTLRPSLPFVASMYGNTKSVEDQSIKDNKGLYSNSTQMGNSRGGGERKGKGQFTDIGLTDVGIGGGGGDERNWMTGTGGGQKGQDFVQKLRKFSLMGGGLTPDQLQNSIDPPQDPKTSDGTQNLPQSTAAKDDLPTSFHGYLFKKHHHKGGLQYLHGDPWNLRWFVLDEGRLFYYLNEEEWRNGSKPRNLTEPIAMGGYEVMVNPKDFEFGFKLESIGSAERDWELRAETEPLRLAWVKMLLKSNAIVGNTMGSDMENVVSMEIGEDETTNPMT